MNELAKHNEDAPGLSALALLRRVQSGEGKRKYPADPSVLGQRVMVSRSGRNRINSSSVADPTAR